MILMKQWESVWGMSSELQSLKEVTKRKGKTRPAGGKGLLL